MHSEVPTAENLAEHNAQELLLRNRQLAGFHRISELIQAEEVGPQVFDEIAREVSHMAGFPVAAVELCDFDRAVMIFRGAHGIPLDDMPTPFEVPMDVTLSGEVARTGQVLVETRDSERREFAAPFLNHLGMQTFVCVPIRTQRHVTGTLTLAHPEKIFIEPRFLKQTESLANYLATLFDRLHARETARRGEAELAAVYDRAPSVMCLFDEQLRVVRANRAAAEFVRRDPARLRPMAAGEFFRCSRASQPGNRCFAGNECDDCQLRRAVTETFLSGKNWQRVRVRKLLSLDNGPEEVVVLLSTERIQVDGISRVLMCLEDVTQTERADEQIRSQAALLDITRDAILVRDFSDRITYWNEGAHRLYGWAASEVLGKTMSQVLLGSKSEPALEALQTVREKEDWTGEMRHRTRQGAEIIVQSRWTLVRERNGTPKSILVVSTDITEKKQLEAQLLRVQRLESIGTLASGLAHDLNNVLAPIMMATHLLKEGAADEATRAWIQMLEICSRRGGDIVRQVLMFARGVEGSRVPLQPRQLVQEMERIAREIFPRSIQIVTHFCRQPQFVEADATQMQQVLMNLCVNARDAMPDGGVLTLAVSDAQLSQATARIHPKAHPGHYVVLSVSDTGTGIPPELMDKIFDPFFTTKPLGNGTGLGLPTVLGITESHGGFVHVESQPGRGTTFKVYLPAVQPRAEDVPGGVPMGTAPQGHGELILAVDDEPAIRRMIEIILAKNGYRTLLAADGSQAVALYRQHQDQIKLLITDLMMPKMDGPATLRAIRQIQPAIKAVTITGLGEENRLSEARAAGANAFLQKPFTSEQLLSQVCQLLGQP